MAKRKIWKEELEWVVSKDRPPKDGKFRRNFYLNVFGNTDVLLRASFYNNYDIGKCESNFDLVSLAAEHLVDNSVRCSCSVHMYCENEIELSHFMEEAVMPIYYSWDSTLGDLRVKYITFTIEFSRDMSPHVSTLIPVSHFTLPLLKERAFSDVVVVCEDQTFNCHKIILAGISEVFKTMLSGDFREAKENKIEIKPFKPGVVAHLIEFIYEGCVSSEKALTWELFEAAKMYDIDALQQICLKSLRENINPQNCCKMLEAAALHDLGELFHYAEKFFKRRSDAILHTDGWKHFTSHNKRLAEILLRQIERSRSDSQLPVRRNERLRITLAQSQQPI